MAAGIGSIAHVMHLLFQDAYNDSSFSKESALEDTNEKEIDSNNLDEATEAQDLEKSQIQKSLDLSADCFAELGKVKKSVLIFCLFLCLSLCVLEFIYKDSHLNLYSWTSN